MADQSQDDLYSAPDADLEPEIESQQSVGAGQDVATSFGDTLGAFFNNVGKAFSVLAGVAAIWAVLMGVTQGLSTPEVVETTPALGIVGGLASLALLVLMPAFWIYGIQKFHNVFEGRPGGNEMDMVKSRYLAYLGFWIVSGIMMLIGFVLCVIPGIILSVILYPAQMSVILEDRGPIDAIKRGFDIINEISDWFYAFGLTFLISLLVMVPLGAVAGIAEFMVGGFFAAAVGNAIWFFAMFPAFILLYYLIFRGLVARAEAPMTYEQGYDQPGDQPRQSSEPVRERPAQTDGTTEPGGTDGTAEW